ncbi:MAG: hypothetical protein AAGF26_10475 [Cyanobacteria bacterium P01_G01_bin.49]
MSKYPINRNDKSNKKIILYVVGLSLIIIALFIILKQFGLLSAIPGYVFLVIALIIIGVSIIAGINKS